MGLKDSIKGNILTANNRYKLTTEKQARVVGKTGNKDNSYSISIFTKDGAKTICDNVPVKYDGALNILLKEPEVGDIVYVIEDQGKYTITGIYEEFQNKTLFGDIYSAIMNSGIGGFAQ